MSHIDWSRTYGTSAAGRAQPSYSSGGNYYSGSNYNSGTNYNPGTNYSSETNYNLGSNYKVGTNYLNTHLTVDSQKTSPYDSRSTSPAATHLIDKSRKRASSPETADFSREAPNDDVQPGQNDVMELVKCVRKLQVINLDEVEKTLKEYKQRKSTVVRDESMKEELKQMNSKFVALEETYNSMEKKYTQAVEEKSEIEEKLKKAKEEFQAKDNEIKYLKRVVSEKDAELTRISKDKDSALSRLSKEMGDKLSKENTTIADLSDPNRSTKLAELYNSIYDNEWTDALETLQTSGLDEEHAIRTLLEIMKNIYEFCKSAKGDHLQQLEKHIFSPFFQRQAGSSQSIPTSKSQAQIRDMVANCVKLAAKDIVPDLTRNYLTMRNKPVYAERVPEYVVKAMELCWLMNLASPPLVFGDQPLSRDTIDKNLYREYTKQGDLVSFVVWLPLLIEQKGAVLLKGVAQPIQSFTKLGRSTGKERSVDRNNEESKKGKHHDSTEDVVSELFDTNTTGRVNSSKHTEHALGSRDALYGKEFVPKSHSSATRDKRNIPGSDFTKSFRDQNQIASNTTNYRGTTLESKHESGIVADGQFKQNYDTPSVTETRLKYESQTGTKPYLSSHTNYASERSDNYASRLIDGIEYADHHGRLIFRTVPNGKWHYVKKDQYDSSDA